MWNFTAVIKIVTFGFACLALLSNSACAPVLVAGTVAGASATIASDRRDTATILNDTGMEMRLTDRIYSDDEMGNRVRVTVTVFNRLILLTGEAPTAQMRDKLTDLARELEGAREVYNEVAITDPIPLNSRTHDSWISSKIKTRLIANRGLFTRTRVITSNGTVYLMGLATRKESDQATAIVSDVSGIQGIVSLFEPISEAEKDAITADSQQLAKQQTDSTVDSELLADEAEDLRVIDEADLADPESALGSATVSNE